MCISACVGVGLELGKLAWAIYQVVNQAERKMRKAIILWIARVLRVRVNSLVSRRFRHKNGFVCDTDYIEVIGIAGKSIFHLKNGATKDASDLWSLEDCLREVRNDRWIEIAY